MEFRGMMGASALAILMGTITPACADQSVVAFYKGRTIDLVVGCPSSEHLAQIGA